MKPLRMRMHTRRTLASLLFISPWILGFLLFFLRPIFISLRLSFGSLVNIVGLQTTWAGWTNYVRAFTIDVEFMPRFLGQVGNTFLYTPLITAFSLILAMLLNQKIRGKGFFRVVFFLPVLLGSGVVMAQLQETGMQTRAIEAAAAVLLPERLVSYLGPNFAAAMNLLLTHISDILWKCGVQIILFLSGLQTISPSLYESARCDAATGWEMFWFITLPMMSPIILLTVVYTIIDSFADINNQVMGYILQMKTEMDYAAAIGWIYFVFIFLVVILLYGILGRRVYQEKGR